MKRFTKVLVANRGEIAVRVIRTCRKLGYATVAVYSDADAEAPHVDAADEAVRIGPAPPAQSYLDVAAILEAARRTGAQAIHPGYGFLAENAAFARAVGEAGLVFIGPRPETIEQMGSKAGARAIMAAAGVPVVPGYDGADQDDVTLRKAAEGIGFPLLVKASAGGGGKGMTIVRSGEALPEALAQARRVARAAFGDDRLVLERYVESPRHIEVQIFGDEHGHVMHLFERDCSVQRRFQKIIEESPAPHLTDQGRALLQDAATTCARAIGYVGAGTVEFVVSPAGEHFFLEVNTRLQVEHAVTEMITRLDLVELQLRVAQGDSIREIEPSRRGCAIEARLCAEDPARGFVPSTGRIWRWRVPLPARAGHRVDAGVAVGSEIGIEYDSLLAKVMARAEDRDVAIDELIRALRTIEVRGVTTNLAFLIDVLDHPEFRAGRVNTGFIAAQWPEGWRRPPLDAAVLARLAVAAALELVAQRALDRTDQSVRVRPAWRNNPWRPQQVRFRVDGREMTVEYEATSDQDFRVRVDAGPWMAVRWADAPRNDIALEIDGVRRRFAVHTEGDRLEVESGDDAATFDYLERFPPVEREAPGGGAITPMPGKVVKLLVKAGDTVVAGAPLVILEAMKMEQTLTAPADGVVRSVRYAVGDFVEPGAVLVELEPPEPPEAPAA